MMIISLILIVITTGGPSLAEAPRYSDSYYSGQNFPKEMQEIPHHGGRNLDRYYANDFDHARSNIGTSSNSVPKWHDNVWYGIRNDLKYPLLHQEHKQRGRQFKSQNQWWRGKPRQTTYIPYANSNQKNVFSRTKPQRTSITGSSYPTKSTLEELFSVPAMGITRLQDMSQIWNGVPEGLLPSRIPDAPYSASYNDGNSRWNININPGGNSRRSMDFYEESKNKGNREKTTECDPIRILKNIFLSPHAAGQNTTGSKADKMVL